MKIPKTMAEKILKQAECRNVKNLVLAPGSVVWEMDLVIRSTQHSNHTTVRVTQSGTGGCNSYWASKRSAFKMLPAAAAAFMGDFEPLDAITAYMEKGDTCLDGAMAALKDRN